MNEKIPQKLEPVNPKYPDIIGQVGDFETPEGFPYSKLIYTKLTKLEKLSEGGNYGKIDKIKIETEDGNVDIFAMKSRKRESSLMPAQTLEIHKKLKDVGVKTFDDMFVGKNGETIISTLLNKDGKIAISSNNHLPLRSTDSSEHSSEYNDIFNKNLKIKNLEKILDSIIEQCVLASKARIKLTYDCLFFLVPENHNNKEVDIDFIVGDFDIIKNNYSNQSKIAHLSLEALRNGLISFVEKYTDNSINCKPHYLKLIQEKLNPTLAENQVMVKTGIKNLSDYTKDDGEILNMNIKSLNADTSFENLEILSKIPNILVDLTHVKDEHKENLISWQGDMEDESTNFNYTSLRIVHGHLNIPNVQSFYSDTLKIVEKSLNAESAESFCANSLETVGFSLNINNAKIFSAENLVDVESIYLRKLNFPKYINNTLFDWKKASEDGKLVIKEGIRGRLIDEKGKLFDF